MTRDIVCACGKVTQVNSSLLSQEDLQKRIELLKVAGVRRYKEGDLEIDFAPAFDGKAASKALPHGAILVDPARTTQ